MLVWVESVLCHGHSEGDYSNGKSISKSKVPGNHQPQSMGSRSGDNAK
jgi:hypothetical protein